MNEILTNQVIYSGHMTEKASLVGQFANAYVFKVNPKASKMNIGHKNHSERRSQS